MTDLHNDYKGRHVYLVPVSLALQYLSTHSVYSNMFSSSLTLVRELLKDARASVTSSVGIRWPRTVVVTV